MSETIQEKAKSFLKNRETRLFIYSCWVIIFIYGVSKKGVSFRNLMAYSIFLVLTLSLVSAFMKAVVNDMLYVRLRGAGKVMKGRDAILWGVLYLFSAITITYIVLFR